MKWVVIGMVIVALVGCATTEFRDNGLHHKKHNYWIRYSGAVEYVFVNSSWVIDNYEYKEPHYYRKEGRQYRNFIYTDWEGDGMSSTTGTDKYTDYFADLVMRHKNGSGKMWVSTRGIPPHLVQTDLDVFLENYVQYMALGHPPATRIDPFGMFQNEARQKTVAIKVAEKDVYLSKWGEVVVAKLVLADLARLKLDEDHRQGMIQVVMMRIDGTTMIPGAKRYSLAETEGKALLFVAYHNTPEHFETHLPEFDSFLDTVVVGKETPVSLGELLSTVVVTPEPSVEMPLNKDSDLTD
jgi:hypothetical protein